MPFATRKIRPLSATLEVPRPRGPQADWRVNLHMPADTPFQPFEGLLRPTDADYIRTSSAGKLFHSMARSSSGKPTWDPDLERYVS